ncbi:hypothetical protein JCM10207_007706 [Rhodosporidiobolus poonsookiae]
MTLVGALTPLRAALLTVAQILGGITGSAIIQALLPGTLNVRALLSPGTSIARGLKHKATFLTPIGIGLALFIAEMLGVYYTGASLNPARSFGPAVVLTSFSGYHWIYWVGPALGATIAAGFYRFIKWLEYETVFGPEDAAAPTLQAPATTMLGSTGAPAGPAAAPATSGAGEKPAPSAAEEQTGGVDVQGPGLGDLFTAGPTQAVYSLSQPAEQYGERLERIEALLAQLVGQGVTGVAAAPGGTQPASEGKGKVSLEGTLYEEEQGHGRWKRDSPV